VDRRDQELLEKQLHGLTVPPRHDGSVIVALLAAFFSGMTLGGFLYAYTSVPPVQLAANETPPASAQFLR